MNGRPSWTSSSGCRRPSPRGVTAWRRSSRSTSSRSGARSARCRRAAAGDGGSGRARSDPSSKRSPRRARPTTPSTRSGQATRPCRSAAGAARSGRRRRRSTPASRRSRPITGERCSRTRIPNRATSTSGSTRSRPCIGRSGVAEAELPPLHDAGDFTSARSGRGAVRRTFAEYHDGGAPDLGALVPRLDDRPPRPGPRRERSGRSPTPTRSASRRRAGSYGASLADASLTRPAPGELLQVVLELAADGTGGAACAAPSPRSGGCARG